MQKFGSECFAYKQDKRKLEKCVFIGYDKTSPAYIVCFPDGGKVQKNRKVKVEYRASRTRQDVTPERVQVPVSEAEEGSQPKEAEAKHEPKRYPSRVRRMPYYLRGYVSLYASDEETNQVQSNIDYCYRVTCNIPVTFTEALSSDKSKEWVNAMDEEMQSLKENNTFTLTNLPEGKKAVGGRWVYAPKKNVDDSEKYKARYVAKGYSQNMGVD